MLRANRTFLIVANSLSGNDSVRVALHPLIPTISSGHRVVPHELDQYAACFIAPDHLLTGHCRDWLKLSLKLLPSTTYRYTLEAFMLEFLRDANLPVQNRLVNHDKKAIFSMSMSELYALGIVSETAIHATIKTVLERQAEPPMTAKFRDAVSLVASCSRLQSVMLYIPLFTRDGFGAVESFERDQGMAHLRHLQVMTDKHLEKVANICHMKDSDVILLENPRNPRRKKEELTRTHRETLMAIRIVDKPNVHRLRELVYTTLPMVGFIGRVRELVLERTLQDLKRAIKKSNNKGIQLHSVQSAAINGWQGRLTLLVNDVLAGERSALRGCLRLLKGLDEMEIFEFDSSASGLKLLHHIMGPHACFARELLSMVRTVLSPKTDSIDSNHIWRLRDIVYNHQND